MPKRRPYRLGIVVVVIVSFFLSSQLLQARNHHDETQLLPGYEVELHASSVPVIKHVPARERPKASTQSATILVNYSGFSAEAREAFQYAVSIWAQELNATVPIVVDASWEPMGGSTLGSAGPVSLTRRSVGGTNYLFPIGLANQLEGRDLSPSNADIRARFSSSRSNWYFGTDGNVPRRSIDFVSVVLHELGHGLGFVGGLRVSEGSGNWRNSLPNTYDRHVVDGANRPLIDTSVYPKESAALAQVLTGDDIYFNGPQTRLVAGGRVKLYAPSTWDSGSSFSHLDEDFFPPGDPNALMTPVLNTGESLHDVGDITRAMLLDMGWPSGSAQEPTIEPSPTQQIAPTRQPSEPPRTETPSLPDSLHKLYLPWVSASDFRFDRLALG